MKIFAVKNEYKPDKAVNTFIIYYEKAKKFFVEITDGADEWDVPFYFDALVRKGFYTVDARSSMVWVKSRIIPPDRQNIGQILRDNGLECYDEYKLLMLGEGRCAQDDYCLVPIKYDDLPEEIRNRQSRKIDEVIPLCSSKALIVFFNDSKAKLCKTDSLPERHTVLKEFLQKHPERFNSVKTEIGGYGVYWNDNMFVFDSELYNCGSEIQASKSDFTDYFAQKIVNTAQAAEILGCTRQNIDDLIKRGKLMPIKETAKEKLFLKSDVLKREWM